MKLLIKLDTNWADEFDVQGFFTTTRKEWDKHLASAKKYFDTHEEELELYFGTNEALTFESYEEYESAYSATELSDEQFALLKTLFGVSYSGEIEFGIVDCYEDYDDDSDEENEKRDWSAEEIFEHVKSSILAELVDSTEEITPDTLIGDLSDDQLVFLELITAIECDFKIDIPDDLIEKFKTVQDVVDYIVTSMQMNKTFETQPE